VRAEAERNHKSSGREAGYARNTLKRWPDDTSQCSSARSSHDTATDAALGVGTNKAGSQAWRLAPARKVDSAKSRMAWRGIGLRRTAS